MDAAVRLRRPLIARLTHPAKAAVGVTLTAMSRAALALVVGVPITLFAALVLPLSTHFLLYLVLVNVVVVAGLLTVLSTVTARPSPAPMASATRTKPGVLHRHQIAGAMLCAALVLFTSTGAGPRPDEIREIGEHFVIVEMGTPDRLGHDALHEILDSARQESADFWELTDRSTIEVFLYGDREEYLRFSPGSGESIGAMECLPGGARLYLYMEGASPGDAGRVDPSVARHEVAHAVMCEALGHQAFNAIPTWLHEGYARAFESSGWQGWWTQAANRITVWLEAPLMMSPEEFCGLGLPGGQTHTHGHQKTHLYGVAWEFLRYLDGAHEREILVEIGILVRDGLDVQDAIVAVTGESCEAAYAAWAGSFNGPLLGTIER
ncbi:MAG: hypothetical protein WD533_02600 [Dehalococcoidia bacterium]